MMAAHRKQSIFSLFGRLEPLFLVPSTTMNGNCHEYLTTIRTRRKLLLLLSTSMGTINASATSKATMIIITTIVTTNVTTQSTNSFHIKHRSNPISMAHRTEEMNANINNDNDNLITKQNDQCINHYSLLPIGCGYRNCCCCCCCCRCRCCCIFVEVKIYLYHYLIIPLLIIDLALPVNRIATRIPTLLLSSESGSMSTVKAVTKTTTLLNNSTKIYCTSTKLLLSLIALLSSLIPISLLSLTSTITLTSSSLLSLTLSSSASASKINPVLNQGSTSGHLLKSSSTSLSSSTGTSRIEQHRALVGISTVTLSTMKNLLHLLHTSILIRLIVFIMIVHYCSISAQANKQDKDNTNEQEPDNKSDAYSDAGSNITKILNAFFDSGYDKRVRPEYGGPPVQVGVSMHIIGISSVSEVQMDFTSDFYFRQIWKDNRLAFTPAGGIDNLVVGAEVAQKIWVPDTFFANEKVASFHSATTPNTFLRILNTGEVYRSIRLTVTASCPMNLQYFPMDSQLCTIEIESYGYSMADIVYIWAKGKESIGMSKGLELPQFKVVGYRQSFKIETLSTGNYSRLVCEIQFERSMGYYLIQIYIPASLIVIISWVSFWLHRNATPARVALGVTTVLTMTTLMSSTNAALPKISYIKSIDVFLGTCFVMVFASLLEYATVGYLGKRIAMRKTRSQQLAKLAQEHRNRCAAAAAAAAAAAVATGASSGNRTGSINLNMTTGPGGSGGGPSAGTMSNPVNGQHPTDDDGNELSDQSIPPPMPMSTGPGMICQSDLSATLHRPLKPIPIHQTMDRFDRYATIGTPRIVHHPSMSCPPTCPQAYARQDIRLNRATPILSGPECVARKSFSGAKPYSGHHPPDSPIPGAGAGGGTPSIGMSAACSTMMLPPPAGAMPPGPGLMAAACNQPTSSQSPTINLHKRHQHSGEYGMAQDGDNGSLGGQQPPPPPPATGPAQHFGPKNPNKLFGVSPSDIDKYSRVVFPVCFVCFNLMYWVIYLHISSQLIEDLIPAN